MDRLLQDLRYARRGSTRSSPSVTSKTGTRKERKSLEQRVNAALESLGGVTLSSLVRSYPAYQRISPCSSTAVGCPIPDRVAPVQPSSWSADCF